MNYGIRELGLYLPTTAVSRADIAAANGQRKGKAPSGDRRVANFDEDALTLAWEALHLLQDKQSPVAWADFAGVEGYGRQAALLALAANASAGVFRLAGGARGGWDYVATHFAMGMHPAVRMALSSLSLARLGDPAASSWSDGAAGLTFGPGAGLELLGSYQREMALMDLRGELGGHYAESDVSPFVAQRYVECAQTALDALKVASPILAISAPSAAAIKRIGKIKAATVVCSDFQDSGYVGPADPAFVLARAVRQAQNGQDIVLCVMGDGVTALHFRLVDKARLRISSPRWTTTLETIGLEQWRRFRRLDGVSQAGPATSQVLNQQDASWEFGLVGVRCQDCQAVSYPAQNRCHVCSSDRVQPQTIQNHGEVFTFTTDHLHDSLSQPTTMIIADLAGGGRVYLQGSDDLAHDVKIGLPVELAFRRIHDGEDGRTPHYFWKLRSRA